MATCVNPPLDGAKFEELYREHHARVLGTCRRVLGSNEEAEDAASEVFLRLPDRMRTYDPGQPFERWISRVAVNQCLDLLRQRRTEHERIAAVPSVPERAASGPSPFDVLRIRETSNEVREAIFALPERYRVPLVMRYFADLSYDEIAGALGANRSHVAVLIFRAKQHLREILEGESAPARVPETSFAASSVAGGGLRAAARTAANASSTTGSVAGLRPGSAPSARPEICPATGASGTPPEWHWLVAPALMFGIG